jgi:hypothetical protein
MKIININILIRNIIIIETQTSDLSLKIKIGRGTLNNLKGYSLIVIQLKEITGN